MIRKDANVKSSLHILGLSEDEIEVYLALLAASASPLELSRRTGIGRTKVYGTLEVLEKRSLVARQVDEKGARFVVTEPTNLLIHMGDLEAKLKLQLETFHQVMPEFTLENSRIARKLIAVNSARSTAVIAKPSPVVTSVVVL